MVPSPDQTLLLVDGCYWGASYELRLYSLSKPTELPLPVAGYLSYLFGDPYRDSIRLDGKWLDENRVELTYDFESEDETQVRKGTEVIDARNLPDRVRQRPPPPP